MLLTVLFVSHFQLNLLECQKSLRRVFTVVLSQEERRSLSLARTFSKELKFFFRKILQVLQGWTSYTIKNNDFILGISIMPHMAVMAENCILVALSPFRMQWHMKTCIASMMNILLSVQRVLNVCQTSFSFMFLFFFSDESGWQAEAEIDMELFHQASARHGFTVFSSSYNVYHSKISCLKHLLNIIRSRII